MGGSTTYSVYESSNTTSYHETTEPYAAYIIHQLSFYWQWIISIPAIVLNCVVLITYVRVGNLLPPSAQVILTNQSLLEMICSAFSIVWQTTKNMKPDLPDGLSGTVVCVVWLSFYWCAQYAVNLNCAVVSLDRFFAVCFPMKRVFTRKTALITVIATDLFSCAVVFSDVASVARYDGNTCVNTPRNRAVNLALGIFQMTVFSLSPFLVILLLYPPMIATIIQSGKKLGSASSSDKIRNAATNRLVRTCLIAAVALLIANVPDIVFYYFFYFFLNITNSEIDSYETSISTMLTSTYPFIAPIIYSFSTPRFRDAVSTAFNCKKK